MIGYVCAVEALTLSLIAFCSRSIYRQVPDDETDLFPERNRELKPMTGSKHYDFHNHTDVSTSPPIVDGHVTNNHNNCNTLSSPECNKAPYIPGMFSLDEAIN